ncbi:hypothetical protein PENTCL1PPCAC_28003, partial [Pristionchus entomophagus]
GRLPVASIDVETETATRKRTWNLLVASIDVERWMLITMLLKRHTMSKPLILCHRLATARSTSLLIMRTMIPVQFPLSMRAIG